MDGKKHSTSASSSSSFTADLFGSKESSSSSFFNSIFPPPSKDSFEVPINTSSIAVKYVHVSLVTFVAAHGKEYISSETTKKNYDFATIQDSEEKKDKSRNPKMDMSPFYDQEKSQPCPLSSSIYYGGQDIYPNPHATKNNPGHSTQYNKDGEDDGLASRGNWWQGSLYY